MSGELSEQVSTDMRLARLRAELAQTPSVSNALREVEIVLPVSRDRVHVLKPVDADSLLDASVHDPEQNLPYWAEIWPSGLALAEAILAHPDRVRGRRVLEIGSGLGLTAVAALQVGADLTVADYSPESLLLCRYNCLWNTGREPHWLQINWRKPSDELFAVAGAGFPVVLAADVLYEWRDVEPLLALADRLVEPGGALWLAEPGRDPARRFLELAGERGWSESVETFNGPWPDPEDRIVHVAVHLLRRGKAGDRST